MPQIFLDTNIAIALLNPHDKLHQKATNLMNRGDVVIPETALMEANNTFLRKFNTSMLEVYKILNKARTSGDELELQDKVVNGFKALIKKKPEYEDFYKFIYDELKTLGIRRDTLNDIPRLMNERAIEITTSLRGGSGESDIYTDPNVLKKVRRTLNDINFKNFMDFEIVCEAFPMEPKSTDLVFITADKECYKKAKKALDKLKLLPEFEKRKLKVELLGL